MADVNPVLVEVSRGEMIENQHRGAAAVVDSDGKVVAAWGDIDGPVYARSAIKPLQALALIETGAAEKFRLGDAEIALACASHSGEPAHVETVERWLTQIGLGPEDLECGAHLPLNENAAAELLRAGATPSALHNNCSGKHAGFLTTAVHLGEPTRGYTRAEHPVQQRLQQLLQEMSGAELTGAPCGMDGCGIPVIGMALRAIATAMAQLAGPTRLPPRRVAAAERVRQAMAAAPEMVAGNGRFCTEVMRHTGHNALIKIGAEGVFTAALPRRKLGVALKIDDGASRAAEVAIGALMLALGVIDRAAQMALSDQLEPPVHNRPGAVVGRIRSAPGWPGRIR